MQGRRTNILVVVVILVAAIAMPAMAAYVSSDCLSGGNFVTYGTADNWQDHTHDGYLWHTWYDGRKTKSHNWGFETGMEYGTVNGPNLSNPGAQCPI